ncbi:MAG TPA: hypothetical protein VHU84_03095, partial [Lacipirellulaceae bacterium]|nr:hypothetical protein [Lacipirellulaceae bacterium]
MISSDGWHGCAGHGALLASRRIDFWGGAGKYRLGREVLANDRHVGVVSDIDGGPLFEVVWFSAGDPFDIAANAGRLLFARFFS